jgi:hypothetical protein
MGADVMRFMYCDHVPQQNLNFGYGPANEVKRRLLTFWNSASFFVLYANIEGFTPTYRDLERGPGRRGRGRSTAGSSPGRSSSSRRRPTRTSGSGRRT